MFKKNKIIQVLNKKFKICNNKLTIINKLKFNNNYNNSSSNNFNNNLNNNLNNFHKITNNLVNKFLAISWI